MKKKVLVFPCGSEIGLEIFNSVNGSTHFDLIGLSSVEDHGKFVYENYIDGIGYFTDKSFIHDLIKIIDTHNIDILYPTMDSIITYLKRHENQLGIPVVGPSYEVAKICSSKLETYTQLGNVIRVPKLYSKEDSNLPFPLFIKPNIGYGSRNTFKVKNVDEINSIDLNGMILCEYLPGKEFTIDCFSNFDGNLVFVGARERNRTMNGISVNTKTDKKLTDAFKSIAEKINSTIQFRGAWFFQLKLDSKGDACLLEIACRFAGSSAVHRIQGVNFALANLFLSIGINPNFIINDFDIESDRSLNTKFKLAIEYDTIFIDFDDTVIIDGKVNLNAIQFIYQSINNNLTIILVTKHNGDIYKSLEKFRLTNLFDQIIHLSPLEEKHLAIRETGLLDSIFIDDSFEERKKVHFELGIPVFSVDSITSLIK